MNERSFMLYHASPVEGIAVLTPHVSNHEKPLVYLSSKRENVLVYLSNAVEKHCRETGFAWNGPWHKWASYGFTKEGILLLEEYYPNATEGTYKGVSGYIYQVENGASTAAMDGIRNAYISTEPVPVSDCEFVPDAYEALLKAEVEGLIAIKRYEALSEGSRRWLEKIIPEEYAKAEQHPEYRHFLQSKFSFLKPGR